MEYIKQMVTKYYVKLLLIYPVKMPLSFDAVYNIVSKQLGNS